MSELFELTSELTNCPPLKDALPYDFENGFTFAGVESSCPLCRAPINDLDVRGRIKVLSSAAILLEAACICHPCRKIYTVNRRIYDDRRTLEFYDGQWLERSLIAEHSLIERVVNFLKWISPFHW